MTRILVVDDDAGVRELLEIMLTREGYSVVCEADGMKGLNRCRKENFDLILTDLKMPKMDGLEFLKSVKELSPGTLVILITAYATGETAVRAMKEGAYDYVEKDFDVDDLKRLIRQALDTKGLKEEQAPFQRDSDDAVHFGDMIARNKDMLRIFSTVRKIGDTPANVLLLGESGTGKELVARAIHDHGPQAKLPFVAINCGGIPENLLESELFGHMKGSFTNAYFDKPGLFEAARGGTIFLDEVGELPPPLQVKLLRVVQEKTFRRIGGIEDIKVNVRIISATNQDLEKKVREGGFREDLYYRLNVIPIVIPPLRNRREDIPILTKHFAEKFSRIYGKEARAISAYALGLLLEYPFPGNVRELENIIERSVALEASTIVLPENLLQPSSVLERVGASALDLPEEGVDLNEAVSLFEKSLIEKALQKTKGAKNKAAELLKVTDDSLKYKIEKFEIV
ncbi:MAG: Transcriptional regulatory protein ZraR [Syntrophaceae bacterium PtaU1.Bin231]|nr:MAG: Transcriptional regulatory protein ZraR [Syntrophaceae bacterium PtaU1.Bin231]HOG16005.1 sigma-54 dependent transcriptional regulator [Syntrophales bacterium]